MMLTEWGSLLGPYGLTTALVIALGVLWKTNNADKKDIRDQLAKCQSEHLLTTEKVEKLTAEGNYMKGRLDVIEAQSIYKQTNMIEVTKALADAIVNASKGPPGQLESSITTSTYKKE